MTTPSKHETRILKKLDQLCSERAKKPLHLQSVAHLSRDLNAAAVAELERRKTAKN